MRHLHKLGATAFDELYTPECVSAYLLSIRLRSISIDPKELSEAVHISRRTAQRYAYNGHRGSSICLSTIYRCLNYIGISLSAFFKDVEYFLNNKIQIALYDLKSESILMYSLEEYERTMLSEEVLINTLQTRRKLVDKGACQILKDQLVPLDNIISYFPMELIKEFPYARTNVVSV